MKRIEKNIISSVFDSQSYNRVSFLEPDDFNSPRAKAFWELISSHNGDIVNVVLDLEERDRKDLIEDILHMGTVMEVNMTKRMSLILLEMRFKRLLKRHLYNLSLKSDNPLEQSLLKECFEAVEENDVFDLMYNIKDYLGFHRSDYTSTEIDKFIKYVEDRIEQVKAVSNEYK